MVLYLMVICVVMLYILSIVYVIRDAQRRGAEPWWMWAIISVIPIVGLLAYVILRPSSYLIDREEQDLDIALREHQLSHYGICPKCGAPSTVTLWQTSPSATHSPSPQRQPSLPSSSWMHLGPIAAPCVRRRRAANVIKCENHGPDVERPRVPSRPLNADWTRSARYCRTRIQ